MIRIKRIYDDPSVSDGTRVLVDRLWPRGISKERAALDEWLKEIAPSPELRKWFDHKPERFAEFTHKYIDELSNNPAAATLEQLAAKAPNLTLLYAARDTAHNEAVVLQQFLEKRLRAHNR